MQLITKTPFSITCNDGVELKGLLLIPESPKAVVQFNTGTGAKKEFYLPFLNYVAEHGFICCLWDYRGSGESAPANMRNCTYTFSDYGLKDMPQIRKFLQEKYKDLPHIIIGHSAGGQQIGFMNNLNGIRGILNFAVSSGYFLNMPFSYRMRGLFFFYVFSPISIFFTGYVKAKPFKFMENLPRNVVREWRSWLTREDYFFDTKFYTKTVPKGNFASFEVPIHTYWTTDDTISNEANTKAFWKHIKSSKPISFTRLVPAEMNKKTIDHFGFFKKNMQEQLWPDVIKKLNEFIA